MIGDMLCRRLDELHKTAYVLSKETGLSEGQISRYKHNKSEPLNDQLIKIADALDCSVDYLLGRTDNPEVNR